MNYFVVPGIDDINNDNILVNIQGTPVHVHLSSVKSEWFEATRKHEVLVYLIFRRRVCMKTEKK